MQVKCKDRKLEWDPDVERRSEAIYIYGTDDMDTKAVLGYFSGYGPKAVEWVNLSSAVVVFEDGFTAKRGLLGVCGSPNGAPLTTNGSEVAALGADVGSGDVSEKSSDAKDGDDTVMTDSSGEPKAPIDPVLAWHEGPPFVKGNRETKILLRIATIEDLKPPDATPWRGGRAVSGSGGYRRRRSGGKRSRNSDHMDIDYGLGGDESIVTVQPQRQQIEPPPAVVSEEELERRRKRRERFSAFIPGGNS